MICKPKKPPKSHKARKPNLKICRKVQGIAEEGNSCLTTPGTCESCPEWAKQKISKPNHTQSQLLLVLHLRELFPQYRIHTEFRFHPERKWRLDVAIPANNWGFEANGHRNGIHGKGWSGDAEKRNAAQALGWKVFEFTNKDILSGKARQWIAENLLGDKR